jgi:hypothetical protein
MADQERAERSSEPFGFRRRYPRTRNFYVTEALNYLLVEYGLSQFCVSEAEPTSGRVRRFSLSTKGALLRLASDGKTGPSGTILARRGPASLIRHDM